MPIRQETSYYSPHNVAGNSSTQFSPRSLDMLKLRAKGLGTVQIADELGISKGAVKALSTILYNRLGVTSNIEAVRKGVEMNLVNRDEVKVDETNSQENYEGLTPRQKEILVLIAKGKGNKQIARTLVITDSTVKNHITSTLKSLGVSSRAGAVIVGIEMGEIDLPHVAKDIFPESMQELTQTEKRVMEALISRRSNSNSDLAESLGLTRKTITRHLASVNRKLSVVTRVQAAIVYLEAKRRGIIPPSATS